MEDKEENFMEEDRRYTYAEISEIVADSIIHQNVKFGRKAILYKDDMVCLGKIMVAFSKRLNPKILNYGK